MVCLLLNQVSKIDTSWFAQQSSRPRLVVEVLYSRGRCYQVQEEPLYAGEALPLENMKA